MKTLNEIKDEVAKERGYEDFHACEIRTIFSENPIAIQVIDEAAKLYAESALRSALDAIHEADGSELYSTTIDKIISELK